MIVVGWGRMDEITTGKSKPMANAVVVKTTLRMPSPCIIILS